VKTWHTVHYLAVLIIRPPNRFLFFAAAAPRIFHSHISLAHLSAPRAEDDERAFLPMCGETCGRLETMDGSPEH
jgi:hypothetical protein